MAALERETTFFEQHRQEWLVHHEGKFALIHGEELVGVFDTVEAAYTAGVDRFGNVPLLIKQVLPDDPIEQAPALMCGLIDARS